MTSFASASWFAAATRRSPASTPACRRRFVPADLFAPNADGTLPDRILIVDIFKEYPIGNSRSWLPKAIEEDGLQVVPLLETPQMRAIEILLPERAARLR